MKVFETEPPLIYLITAGEATAGNFREKSAAILRLIEKSVEARVGLVQIREKQLPARLLYELVRQAAGITRPGPTKLLVNERADVAVAAGADGVHLPAGGLSAEIVRAHFPEKLIIGVSTHSAAEAVLAKRQKADFVTFGPVFATPSKAGYGAPQGIERLAEVCRKVAPLPVVALGGIDAGNWARALAAGAGGIAAIRFLNNPENLSIITQTIRQFREKI